MKANHVHAVSNKATRWTRQQKNIRENRKISAKHILQIKKSNTIKIKFNWRQLWKILNFKHDGKKAQISPIFSPSTLNQRNGMNKNGTIDECELNLLNFVELEIKIEPFLPFNRSPNRKLTCKLAEPIYWKSNNWEYVDKWIWNLNELFYLFRAWNFRIRDKLYDA